MKSSTIMGADNGTRSEMDFYSTPKEVTIALVDFLKKAFHIDQTERVLEPCCGNGAISNVLLGMGFHVTSFDIRDTGFGGGGIDYLKTECRADIIITNPPFSLAEQFIKKANCESDIVCMLLKAHYRHSKKRLLLWESNVPSFVLPLTWRPDWKKGNSSPTMDFQWTVWYNITKHKANNCQYVPLKKPTQNEE